MDRQFFSQQGVQSAKSHLMEFIKIDGTKDTVISGKGGLLIDATISNATVRTDDDSPIYFSSMSKLDNVTIIGKEVLIEGEAYGVVIHCSSRIEFGEGAEVVGVLHKTPTTQMFVHELADLDDFTIKTAKVVVAAQTGNSGYDSSVTIAALASV